jgi:hypothetical protein
MHFNIILPSTSSGEDSEEQIQNYHFSECSVIQNYHFSECSVMLMYRHKLRISHLNLLQIRVTAKDFSLFRPWRLMGGVRRVIAPFILNLGSRLWWLVNNMPPPLYPWERTPCNPWKEGGPQSQSWRFAKEKNLFPLLWFESRIVQHLA